MNNKTVGSRITTALEANNITRKHIAEQTGISSGALSDYINDNRTPNLANTLALAHALHVSPSWLAWGLGIKEANAQQITFKYVNNNLDPLHVDPNNYKVDGVQYDDNGEPTEIILKRHIEG